MLRCLYQLLSLQRKACSIDNFRSYAITALKDTLNHFIFVSAFLGESSHALFFASVAMPSSDNISWGFPLGVVGNMIALLGVILMFAGSIIVRREAIRETERSTTFTRDTMQSNNMTMVAVPISFLTPQITGSQTNLPIVGVVPVVPQTTQNHTSSNPVQSPSASEPAATVQPAADASPASPDEVRMEPSAPPPELRDLYY